jgi:hypothetical protein
MFKKEDKFVNVLLIQVQKGEKTSIVRVIDRGESGCTNIEKVGILEIAKKQILDIGKTKREK